MSHFRLMPVLKLNHYGIRYSSLSWIADFLGGRSHDVGYYSTVNSQTWSTEFTGLFWPTTIFGVGYINDLPNIVRSTVHYGC